MPTGTATVDFGASPGTQRAVATITGQSGILAASSHADAFLMGDSTVDHNAYEHTMVPMNLRVANIVDGVGFDVVCTSDWRLHGTFIFHWVWL